MKNIHNYFIPYCKGMDIILILILCYISWVRFVSEKLIFISPYLDLLSFELHLYSYIITNIQCLGITKQQESGCITINMKNHHNLLISSCRGWIYWPRRAFDIIFLVDIGPATLFSIYCYSDLVSWDHKIVKRGSSFINMMT